MTLSMAAAKEPLLHIKPASIENLEAIFPCMLTYLTSWQSLKVLTSSSLAGLTPSENIYQNATKL
jgi:hypothetical protein